MANSTARASGWGNVEMRRPQGKQSKRHLNISAWHPQKRGIPQPADFVVSEAEESSESEHYRSAMQSRYLSFANGLVRVSKALVQAQRAGRYEPQNSPNAIWHSFAGPHCLQLLEDESSEPVRLEWMDRAIELGPERFEVDHLAEVVASTNRELRSGRFQGLGRAVAAMPFESLSPHVISAVLRVMSPAKQLVPNWLDIVRDAAENLANRNLDSKRLLRGLT